MADLLGSLLPSNYVAPEMQSAYWGTASCDMGTCPECIFGFGPMGQCSPVGPGVSSECSPGSSPTHLCAPTGM